MERTQNSKQQIIYGLRPVIEALESGKKIDKILIQNGLTGALVSELRTKMKEAGIWTIIWVTMAMGFGLLLFFKAEWVHGISSMEDLLERFGNSLYCCRRNRWYNSSCKEKRY